MAISNDLNIGEEGVVYFNGTNTFTGIDGSTSGFVLTSNGTNVPPSFQTVGSGTGVVVEAWLNTTQSNLTGDGTSYNPIFDSTYINTSTSYNTTTGVFTAPVAGNYYYSLRLCYVGATVANTGSFIVARINGSNRNFSCLNLGATQDPTQNVVNTIQDGIMPLSVGETIDFVASVSGGTKTVGLFGLTANGTCNVLSIFLLK